MKKNSLEDIFTSGAKVKASDIHLKVGQPPIVRVDGALHVLKGFPEIKANDMQMIATEMLIKPQYERFYKQKELDTSYEISDGTRFRVNFHWTTGTIALAARILSAEVPSMEDIGMPEVAHQMIEEEAGLILVTGPTGSGKTTSIASMVNRINEEDGKHIVTLEDPIEYIYESQNSIIKQREFGADFLSFPEALKRVLRQDPDVIVVGEMRDLETIALAISAAETGHLVFATLHTYSGAQTINRIVDSFPPYQQNQIRLQLSFTLKGVISQRLVPRIGGGRVAAREVLLNNSAAANLIRENKIPQLQTVIETGGKLGMVTMDKALKNLVKEGIVSEEEAMAHSTHVMMF